MVAALEEAFSGSNLRFGQRVTESEIMSVVLQVSPSITSVNVVAPAADVVLTEVQYPNVDSITVTLVGDNYGQV